MSHALTVRSERPEPPPAAVLEELRGYEVAWLSDAGGSHLMDPALGALFPGVPRIAGPAVTVRVPPGDFLLIPTAMKLSRPGDVLVIDGRGDTSRAVWGEYFSAWARGLGLQAVLIDGAARDAGAIEALGYPVFARATVARGPTMHGPGEVGVPVQCGGVPVAPGDLIVADREGAVAIPRAALDEVLAAVRRTAEGEKTKHGFPAGDREQFEAWYELAFAPRVAALADSREPGA